MEPGLESWLKLNKEVSTKWPNLTVKGEPPADAKEWDGKPDKLRYFRSAPHEDSPGVSSRRCERARKRVVRSCGIRAYRRVLIFGAAQEEKVRPA